MKITSVEMENFRAYGGRQQIDFSGGDNRNVTLVYGTNGGGKTTLLNAFTWTLYGKVTPDLENPGDFVNWDAWYAAEEGEEIPVSVAVTFDHGGKTYRAVRKLKPRRRGYAQQDLGRPEFELSISDSSGAWKKSPNPSLVIDKILPSRLFQFFFINGERIEYLAKQEAYKEIQEAVKTLLEIEPLERALKHLPSARTRVRSKSSSSSTSMNKVREEIDLLEEEQAEKRQQRDELKQEIHHIRAEISSIDGRLRTLEGAKALQLQRDHLSAEQKRVSRSLDEAVASRKRLVATRGFLAFLPGLAGQVRDVCDELRVRGELPAPLKRTFVEDLLEQAKCICGTHLVEGSPERALIEQWLSRSGRAEVEAAWNILRGHAAGLEEQRKSTIEDLESLDTRISQGHGELRDLQGRLDEVTAQIGRLPGEDIARLESARGDHEANLGEKQRRFGAVDGRLDALESELGKKNTEFNTLAERDEANKLIQRRHEVLQEAEDVLTKTLDILKERTRRQLDRKIRSVFESSSFKDYVPELTSEFELELWTGTDERRRRAAKSTGENMLLSLSFVAALALQCREISIHDDLSSGDVREFPVVLDASFGSLDIDYQRRVARFLPKMASQMIVLSSQAQSGGVEEHLRDHVGKQYVITTHTRKTGMEDVTESITIDGYPYPYQEQGSSFDGAKLKEIPA
ncbi:hypothetical protein GCM10010430_29020 [Kitasatospora cystarginea]|uniref:Nuclease SbcCD subunit C n=1 Tax=Kitasatospora cystarginea TaxID=58350 RepID=A0ABN3DZS4_9ACTN